MTKDFFDSKIVFYDGDCGFCNATVQLVLKYEKSSEIYFTALQSEFTKRFFHDKGLHFPDFSTFYFYSDGKMYSKSTAAIKLSHRLKFPFPLLSVFFIVPVFIRNGVYDLIAKRRKRIFSNFCFLPSPEQQKRFIKS